MEKIIKARSQFFEKINKVDNTFSILVKKYRKIQHCNTMYQNEENQYGHAQRI